MKPNSRVPRLDVGFRVAQPTAMASLMILGFALLNPTYGYGFIDDVDPMCNYSQIPGFWRLPSRYWASFYEKPGISGLKLHTPLYSLEFSELN